MSGELVLFARAFWYGCVMLFGYDCLRILRRCVKHGQAAVAAEDILYWSVAAVRLFAGFYRENDGILRGYLLLGILAGMAAYRRGISGIFVKAGSAALEKVLKVLALPAKAGKKIIKRLKFWAFRFKLLISASLKQRRQKCSKEEKDEKKTQSRKKKCGKGSQLSE